MVPVVAASSLPANPERHSSSLLKKHMDAAVQDNALRSVAVAAWGCVLLAWFLLALSSAARCHLHNSLPNRHSRGFTLLCSASAGALSMYYFCSSAARGTIDQPFWVTFALAVMWFVAVFPMVLPRREPPRFEFRMENTKENQ